MIIKPLGPLLESQFDILPKEVKFCKTCVMSNQRPRIKFNKDGICQPCLYTEEKNNNKIDYKKRHEELLKLLDHHRSKDGSHDVIVPCSGGKDSSSIAHKLKYKYGMNPLCITFSPPVYSEIGRVNLKNFIDSGFDHKLITPNGLLNKILSKLAFIYIGDHEEMFDRGQMCAPVHEALISNIKLVMYGENADAEYGGDHTLANLKGMPWDMYEKIYYSTPMSNLINIAKKDGYFKHYNVEFKKGMENIWKLPKVEDLKKNKIEFHWWSYYEKWIPQENFYYSTKNTGFQANPEGRMEGTYSKYAQLDDATDALLYYLMFIKYGFGRATSDAAHEVRDEHITREEAVTLVRKFDGEFPDRSIGYFLKFIDITFDEFWECVDRFRLDHIWKKENGKWKLRHQVS